MGIADLLLPDRCAVCGCDARGLCGECRESLVALRPPLCALCGNPVAWPVDRCRECAGRRLAFASARAAVAYEGAAATMVGAWKDGGRRRLARLAAEVVAELVPAVDADIVTFVPGAPGRELWRGFNPAEQLALELAWRWRIPARRLLARVHSPRPQRGLPLAARRANVAGAFRGTAASPGAVVLVDDVYTSGATAAAAANALRRAGARRVDVVTFARTLRAGSR